MTIDITAVPRREQYTGSAGTGPYQFDFEVLAQADIAVYKNSTLLTITTDYTVTINGDGTGSVTLVSPATGSDLITIIGARAIARTTDFVTGGDLLANSLNDELDSLVIFSQQLLETQERTFRFPPSANITGVDLQLPTPSAGKALLWNGSGNGLVNSTDNFNDIVTNATAQAVIATTQAGIATTQASLATAAYDSFDDRYLGAKASDPTLDNDGNALIDGALYFDTTNNVMKVYDLGNTVWKRTTPTTTDQASIDAAVANATNINTVAGISANVTTVAGISANVTSVAGNASNINAAVANATNINTVAGISANVTTVAGISSNVTTVATNVADVNTCAADIAAIIDAPNQAAAAQNSATTAASLVSTITNLSYLFDFGLITDAAGTTSDYGSL